MKGKRVLITGAAGFLGYSLTLLCLEEGAQVFALDRQAYDRSLPFFRDEATMDRVRYFQSDICDPGLTAHAVAVANPDCVFHLAAVTQVTEALDVPYEAMRVNCLGLPALLAGLPKDTPLIHVSSDKVYGRPDGAVAEAVPLAPLHPYDISKAAADHLAQAEAIWGGRQIAIARFANIYGPGDVNWKRIVPGTLRSWLMGEAPILRSTGTMRREYIYVDDAVGALYLLWGALRINPSAGHALVYNFGSGDAITALTMVSQIRSVLAHQSGESLDEAVVHARAIGETPFLSMDSSRARRDLGWTARTGLRDGLRNTAIWMRSFLGIRYPVDLGGSL
jgi:CDP-glucose 4,6-dehydratase